MTEKIEEKGYQAIYTYKDNSYLPGEVYATLAESLTEVITILKRQSCNSYYMYRICIWIVIK